MTKEFYVDKKKRKSLIKQKRKEFGFKVFWYMALSRILYILISLFFLISTIFCINLAIEEGDFLVMGVLVLPFGISAFAYLIPYAIQHFGDYKWMWKWVGRRCEYVKLQSNSILWSHYNMKHKEYYDYQMKYKDIERLLYDNKDQILYAYGPASHKVWEDETRERLCDSFEKDSDHIEGTTWFTIANYFNNFEELKTQLSELTGKEIEER